jgi:energy-coupling factor transport system substrate-specific component
VVFCIVGPLLDTAALFLSMTELNGAGIATVYAAGVPVNAIHAACTVVTILLLVKPIEEKLARIKTKYGLME